MLWIPGRVTMTSCGRAQIALTGAVPSMRSIEFRLQPGKATSLPSTLRSLNANLASPHTSSA